MIGYKAFNKDMTCRYFKYKVGETYELEGELKICENGFHFCKTIKDCYDYYSKNDNTIICEVEALGDIDCQDNKYCTNKIKILKKVSKKEINHINEGRGNIGWDNQGDNNRGDCNRGNDNLGDNNKGNCNRGYYNVGNLNEGNINYGTANKGYENEGNNNRGDDNIGDDNYGDYNRGNNNKGSYNRGTYNIGYDNRGNNNYGDDNRGNNNYGDDNRGNNNIGAANKGDYCCGVGCTKPTLMLFNKPSKHTLKELEDSGALKDIIQHRLTDKVKALDTFDINVWNELCKEE